MGAGFGLEPPSLSHSSPLANPMDMDPAKEWKRVLHTAVGFGKKHGHWPSRLVLPEAIYEALDDAFSAEDWDFLGKEVQLRTGSARVRAEDADGDSYIWGESLATRLTFSVSEAEPRWFALRVEGSGREAAKDPSAPDGVAKDEAVSADALTGALRRLGHPTPDDADVATSVEQTVGRVGGATIKRVRDTHPPETPGSTSAELFGLIRVPRARDVMSANRFRRVKMAVLRVYAAEFTAYFAARALADGDAWTELSQWANTLEELLKRKPTPLGELQAIGAALHDAESTEAETATAFIELVEWVTALALDERRSSEG